jgi:transposase-like protein
MNMNYKSVAQVARELGLTYNTMKYWALTDKIPRPTAIGWAKVYTTEEVEKIRAYMEVRRNAVQKTR